MIIYRFQVMQISRDPFFTNLYCKNPFAYVVHHTLNRNGIYTSGKPKMVPYDKKKKVSLINRSAKGNQKLKHQHLLPFKTNGRKYDFECPIHGIINSGKIEDAYFSRVRLIFLTNTVT